MENNKEVIKVDVKLIFIIHIGRGVNRTISISKIRKIIAKRKNRVENGMRAVDFGSNPHSNGEDFSRSLEDRDLSIKLIVNRRDGIMTASKKNDVLMIIYWKYIISIWLKVRCFYSSSSVRYGEKNSLINVIRVIRSSGAVSIIL